MLQRAQMILIYITLFILTTFPQMAVVVRNPPSSAGDIRGTGSIPGSERSLGAGHGNPFQFSCLKNPMERGAWQATVQWVAELDMTEAT